MPRPPSANSILRNHRAQQKSFAPSQPIMGDFHLPNSSKVMRNGTDINLPNAYISGKKVGVFANLITPADTTITAANTYQPIEGNFNNDPLEGFVAATVNPPGIKYDEELTQFFEIDWHATIKANTATTRAHLGIKKNGVLQENSIMAIC